MEPKTLLVADDCPGMRRLLARCLDEEYGRVLAAADGHAALRLARERLPDLIVLDVLMPGPGGLDVCAALRADERTQGIPVLLLSGLDDKDLGSRGLDGGADDFMAKPFKVNELAARVRDLLRRAA